MNDYFSRVHGVPSMCIETPYALAGKILLTRERYRELGSRFATAVAGELQR